MADNYIHFYGKANSYGEFSNFSKHPVTIDEKVWPTTEHYFQAMKFPGTDYAEDIRQDPNPATAKRMGGTRRIRLRDDWEQVKEAVMMTALRAKFTQHAKLKRLLLSTGDKILIEHTTNDSYWGDGGDGSGKNRLGHLLMELRAELKEPQPMAAAPQTQPQTQSETQTETDIPSNPNKAVEVVEIDVEEEEDGESSEEQATAARKEKKSLNVARQRRAKGRRQRDIWKDADGVPIIEKSSDTHGRVSVAGSGVTVPEKALTGAAKLVVHRYQYQKKFERSQGSGPQDDEEEYDDEEYDEEDYSPPSQTTLGSYLGVAPKVDEIEKPDAESLLALIESLVADLNTSDTSDTNSKLSVLKFELRPTVVALIEGGDPAIPESTTEKLFAALERMDTALAI